jgi:hypothetical protein
MAVVPVGVSGGMHVTYHLDFSGFWTHPHELRFWGRRELEGGWRADHSFIDGRQDSNAKAKEERGKKKKKKRNTKTVWCGPYDPPSPPPPPFFFLLPALT